MFFSASGSIVNGLHSPRSMNGTPSPPAGLGGGAVSAVQGIPANQEMPAACGARQLSKLKRFLTTLQQFGSDISPEIGERVRGLVMGLVVSIVLCNIFKFLILKKKNQLSHITFKTSVSSIYMYL